MKAHWHVEKDGHFLFCEELGSYEHPIVASIDIHDGNLFVGLHVDTLLASRWLFIASKVTDRLEKLLKKKGKK